MAYWAGWPRQAGDYAQQRIALGAGGYISSFLPAVEARAHAALGDRDATTTALRAAQDAADRYQAADLDELCGVFAFPYCRHAYFSAEAHVLLDPASPEALRAAGAAHVAPAGPQPGPPAHRRPWRATRNIPNVG
ncbi:hypothetical protein KDL01_09180 [Actinospica durhamensis]|uniref:Uncharacterized protein n=1 Tax=Actinospica durhamensis TaxID=1508375 RepID=A0A941EMX9_9ACTN|nr:hypothetical protein [Actinospica durhamensis]MBR7833437.1 hypothetical protein [Actinospica durhamensis]